MAIVCGCGAKPIMSQSGFDGELCNGIWHGTLRVTLEDDIDDSTLFPVKVYDVIYPLLEKFTKARGLWLRDVGFWVNGAITKLTTDERAGCMAMAENDQILVRLNGRRRLVVAAEGEGQRHLFECAGGTRWKTAMDFFKVRTGEGFVMLHDGQRVGANQRISTSTALGIVRAQQGGGGEPPGQASGASDSSCQRNGLSETLRITDNGPDEQHAKRQRPLEAESPLHDSDVDSDSQRWCDSGDVSESEEWCVPQEPLEDNIFTRDLEIDEQICQEIPGEGPDEVWCVFCNSRMLMKRKAMPDADNLHPSKKPYQTMVDSGPESHPAAPSSASCFSSPISPVKAGSPSRQCQQPGDDPTTCSPRRSPATIE